MFKQYFEAAYLESGFRIPPNTKSIKLFHHVDLDGVFSAILAYRQLEKQGINGERIQLYPVQYGQQKPAFFNVKPHQAAVVVDFGRLPEDESGKDDNYRPTSEFSPYWQTPDKRVKEEPQALRRPDIMSDHHQTDIKYDDNGRPSNSVNATRAGAERDPKRLTIAGMHRSDSERILTLHAQNLATSETINLVSKIDSADYASLEDTVELKLTTKTLAIIVNAMLTSVAAEDLPVGSPNSRTKGTIEYIIRYAQPSLWSIYNIIKNKSAQIAKDEIDLVKELQKPQEERDNNLINELKSRMSKATVRSVEHGMGRKKMPMTLDEMRGKGEADFAKATNPNKTQFSPNGLVLVSKLGGAGQPGRFTGSLLADENGNRFPVAIRRWPTMMQISCNPDLDPQYKKLINFVDLAKEAIRSARKNFLGKDYIDDADLPALAAKDKEIQAKIEKIPEVAEFIKNNPSKPIPKNMIPYDLKYSKGYQVWLNSMWKKMEDEAGGHASIATIKDFHLLALAPKPIRDELKKVNAATSRLEKLSSEQAQDKLAEYKARQDELKEQKKESSGKRDEIIDYIQKFMIDRVNEVYGQAGVKVTKPLSDPKRYTMKTKEEQDAIDSEKAELKAKKKNAKKEEPKEEEEEKPKKRRVVMAAGAKRKKVKI